MPIDDPRIQELIQKIGIAFALVAFAIFILHFYLLYTILLFVIAGKTGVSHRWMAFIPLLRNITLARAAAKPWWLGLIMIAIFIAGQFVGYVGLLNIPLFIFLWMGVSGNMGKSPLLGLLSILYFFIPVVGLILPLILALSKAPVGAGAGAMTMGGGMEEMDFSREPDVPDLDFDLEEEPPAAPSGGGAPEPAPGGGADEWQLPEEGAPTEEQEPDEWQLPPEGDEGESQIDSWSLEDEEQK